MKNNQFYKNLFDKILNSDEFDTLLDAFVYLSIMARLLLLRQPIASTEKSFL